MKILLYSVFVFFGLASSVYAQTTALIFEGAGMRGIAYAGVVQAMEERQELDQIEKFGGTSAGAIMAMLLTLGYNSNEIFDLLSNTSFESFNDGEYYFPGGLYRLKNQFGWYKGDELNAWLGEAIYAKTNNADITFEELHLLGYPDLYCVATCLNKQTMVVLSHESYPDMLVRDAVHISCAIPFYYRAIFVDTNGHVFDEPANGRDVMLDGGLLANFPISIFDETDEHGNRIVNPHVQGIRIDENDQIEANRKGGMLVERRIDSFESYVESLYVLVLETMNRSTLTPEDWARTISVSSAGIGPKVRRLSAKDKSALLEMGYRGWVEFRS
ncbi:MAG: hypothetical protein GC193_12225 [Cryomorphaceae bacterium]|nr:hypothetical protein [Cryomorphaceae bacterium]